MKDNNIPLHQIYDQREDFLIVALTGITGSGCSDFANLMSKPFHLWEQEGYIRPLSTVNSIPEENKRAIVFKKEYTACHNVCAARNDKWFTIIKYRDVALLYALIEIATTSNNHAESVERLSRLFNGKFNHSFEKDGDPISYEINRDFNSDLIINQLRFSEELYNLLLKASKNIEDLSVLFLQPGLFQTFAANLFELMKQRDYYAKNFFVHRLANTIRATGRSEATNDECKASTNDHVFAIVELINKIIKGFHKNNPKAERRFVIDSIRCSLETIYLRERYSAFYMIAIHNDGRENLLIKQKVAKFESNPEHLKDICKNIEHLSHEESKKDDFEKGILFAPDIERCVTESEIHVEYQLINKLEDVKEPNDITTYSFFSYGEQWMKFYALIMRPGLITPSRDERCMSIAYVAKFNSGCISRQVGCAIVDKENAVQSVGWNDPPAPQLPCNLRYVDELQKVHDSGFNKDNNESYRIYSKFELNDTTKYEPKDDEGKVKFTGIGFCDSMQKTQNLIAIKKVHSKGLPYSYCFRSKYNSFKGNKDQVNTRSLHAEENTMLRISRQGGVGLCGGTMYVTASPCVLCSKKAYQIGIRDIVYLDPYTDIATSLIIECGFEIPSLRPFRGAIGETFYKLYRPFLPFKDELAIYNKFYK